MCHAAVAWNITYNYEIRPISYDYDSMRLSNLTNQKPSNYFYPIFFFGVSSSISGFVLCNCDAILVEFSKLWGYRYKSIKAEMRPIVP